MLAVSFFEVEVNITLASPHQYCVRNAATNDLDRIVELDQEAFSWSNTAEDRSVFVSRLSSFPEGCLVADLGGVIAGYCTSEKWVEEREPVIGESAYTTHCPAGTILCVTGFAVAKAYQHQGLGTAILRALIEVARAQKCQSVILETGDAKTFYARFGFVIVGERSQNGADMWIVRLFL
jgi:ribosomal protein S18 acetylase RimI-like enzyme